MNTLDAVIFFSHRKVLSNGLHLAASVVVVLLGLPVVDHHVQRLLQHGDRSDHVSLRGRGQA